MKVAIVTGAAGGMGRAITDRLLADGLQVVGVDIDGAALLTMAADREGFTPEAVDLTDPEAIADLFDRVTTRFGGVDALVNNAGTCFMS
ncbi:MAG: SDR family NAD(P)-dependent oxidoreductase, partial [Rhodobacterales bacterium]